MTRRWCLRLIGGWLALACLLAGALPAGAATLQGMVTRIYDGDTIKVASVGKVRLLGIDAPERESSERDRYYRRRGIASATLRRVHHAGRRRASALALHQHVLLETDDDTHDSYGRLLAYVRLPDGRLLNRILLEEGLAVVYRRFDFALKSDFLRAERQARQEGAGIWRGNGTK